MRTIEHLRSLGMHGLGLNFAVMRSVLAQEAGDRISHRIERRMLGWLSDSMQIESLWKYNAKFDPDWHPRYAVYDSPEQLPQLRRRGREVPSRSGSSRSSAGSSRPPSTPEQPAESEPITT